MKKLSFTICCSNWFARWTSQRGSGDLHRLSRKAFVPFSYFALLLLPCGLGCTQLGDGNSRLASPSSASLDSGLRGYNIVLRYAGIEPGSHGIASSNGQATAHTFDDLLAELGDVKEPGIDRVPLETAMQRFDKGTNKGLAIAPLRISNKGFAVLIGSAISNSELCCQARPCKKSCVS